jgi:ribonuclease HI
MAIEKLIIYTDGGARGNPGPAGIGAVVYDGEMKKLAEVSEYIGRATNNQAEYKAVIAAFKKVEEYRPVEILFFLDSELVVKQLKGEYRVRNADLAPLFVKIHNNIIKYKKVVFTHVRREKNKEADLLANKAMDRGR